MRPIWLYVLLTVLNSSDCNKLRTVYQRLSHEDQFEQFHRLFKNERNIITDMQYSSLTVFVPTNKAIENYGGETHVRYHMSYQYYDLNTLMSTSNVTTCLYNNAPPIWVTRKGDELYLNNAKLLVERSNYLSRTFTGDYGKPQALHVIDDVLTAEINVFHKISAYDFLSITRDDFKKSERVTSFFQRIHENRQQNLYKQKGTNTYFIPVDSGIDNYKYQLIDKYVIQGHVIENVVLFTRPTEKSFPFESRANGDYIYILLNFVEVNGRVFVKSRTILGDSTHQEGEIVAEIIKGNIPVTNGVVHLISKPLAVFDRKLKPFPFLPVIEKIASDPDLDFTYRLGESYGFNDLLKNESVALTYFVIKDSTWDELERNDLRLKEDFLDVLKNHLFVSDVAFSMSKLVALTKTNNNSDVILESLGGTVRLSVWKIHEEYYVVYQNRHIKVLRPDYECTNGLVHILEAPLAELRKRDNETGGFWHTLKHIFKSIQD